MSESALIGIDLGKHTFHLHCQDKSGREVFRKKCSRAQMMQFFGNSPSCVVVMEACAGSHHVARQLAAMGHTAKLISPQFVKPFVKGNKNDFVDAEAICEAASRPSMRFVTTKTESQQTLSVLHRMRESWVHDRTKTANQMHGFLLEFGISLPKGLAIMKRLANVLAEHELPVRLTVLLQRLHDHFVYLDEQIATGCEGACIGLISAASLLISDRAWNPEKEDATASSYNQSALFCARFLCFMAAVRGRPCACRVASSRIPTCVQLPPSCLES